MSASQGANLPDLPLWYCGQNQDQLVRPSFAPATGITVFELDQKWAVENSLFSCRASLVLTGIDLDEGPDESRIKRVSSVYINRKGLAAISCCKGNRDFTPSFEHTGPVRPLYWTSHEFEGRHDVRSGGWRFIRSRRVLQADQSLPLRLQDLIAEKGHDLQRNCTCSEAHA